MHHVAAATLCGLLATPGAASQLNNGDGMKSIDVAWAQSSVTIDGLLSEGDWQGARPVTDFHQLDPGEFTPPRERTEVRVLRDDEYLYVGMRGWHSNMDKLVARQLLQKAWIEDGDERFIVVIDPYNDRRNGYFFEVNANGVRGDALIENNNRWIGEWDGIWATRAAIHDDHWSVEIAIPFATISFDPDDDVWGINFFRDNVGVREYVAWSSQGRQDFSIAPAVNGTIAGMRGASRGIGLDVKPGAVLRERRNYQTSQDDLELRPSLDVLYKFTPSLNGALTLNSDFSATEVDDREINLSRFSLFFPEKRVFFLQDAGMFLFGGLTDNARPFFSRTIGLSESGEPVDLDAGAKLTGRAGGWSFGALATRQAAFEDLEEQSVFVGRATRDVLEESSIGMIYTQGDPRTGDENRLGGIDFRYRSSSLLPAGSIEATAWTQWSNTGEADEDSSAWGGSLRLPNDRVFIDLWHATIGESFNPGLGFVNRRGVRETKSFWRYRVRPPSGPFLAMNYSLRYNVTVDIDGGLESSYLAVTPWSGFTRNYDSISFLVAEQREVLDEPFALFDRLPIPAGEYVFRRAEIYYDGSTARAVRAGVTLSAGEFYHGDSRQLELESTWAVSPRLQLHARWLWSNVDLPANDFIARLYAIRTTVAFNSRWSWVSVMQYDNVSERVGINSRLRWSPLAGRDVNFVINRTGAYDGDRITSEQQQLALSFSYTLRF